MKAWSARGAKVGEEARVNGQRSTPHGVAVHYRPFRRPKLKKPFCIQPSPSLPFLPCRLLSPPSSPLPPPPPNPPPHSFLPATPSATETRPPLGALIGQVRVKGTGLATRSPHGQRHASFLWSSRRQTVAPRSLRSGSLAATETRAFIVRRRNCPTW